MSSSNLFALLGQDSDSDNVEVDVNLESIQQSIAHLDVTESEEAKSETFVQPSVSDTPNVESPSSNGDSESTENSTSDSKLDQLVGASNGAKVLVLVRGVSGSGKTTLAAKMISEFKGEGTAKVFSTDDYFIQDGKYKFDARKLGEAHAWNQKLCADALADAISPVLIDNTFTQRWEAKPYIELALKYGYQVHVVETSTPWAKDAAELAKRNVHNVPQHSIQRMLKRWENDFTIEAILKSKPPKRIRSRSRSPRGSRNNSRSPSRRNSPRQRSRSPHRSTTPPGSHSAAPISSSSSSSVSLNTAADTTTETSCPDPDRPSPSISPLLDCDRAVTNVPPPSLSSGANSSVDPETSDSKELPVPGA